MRKLYKSLLNNKFIVTVFLILLLAGILRFYDYASRFVIGPDQAGFAVQAKYAMESLSIPMLGPFASGAPFQTGGEWYWFIALGYLFIPFSSIAPWILLTLSSILFIFILIYYAKEIEDKTFALIVGLLAALSTAQIAQSVNLTNQSPQSLFSVIVLYLSHKLLKTKKQIYAFWMGIIIGLASAIHLQGGALVAVFFLTAVVGKIKSIKVYFAFLLGAFIPWAPVLIKDINNNFFNTKNMAYYYLFNENPIPYEALGRRWLTFSTEFIPKSWAFVTGGNYYLAFALIFISIIIFLYLGYKRKLKRDWIIIFFSFLISIIILRYTRTPIFDSYFVFLHPLFYLITGFAVYYLYRFKKIIGLLLLSIIVIASLKSNVEEISTAKFDKSGYPKYINNLESNHPNEKFSVYDYKFKNKLMAIPLVFYLYSDDKLRDDGMPIGINISTTSASFNMKYLPILNSKPGGLEFYDLSQYSKDELEKMGWININPSALYNETQNWYK